MQLAEPTFQNLIEGIEKIMAVGVGFRMVIGATRQGVHWLQDDREERLPLGEMI